MRIVSILFFLLSSCIIANAQNKKSLIKDGNKLYTDSSFNMAEMKYRKALEKDQDYFNASFNLADAIYKQERFEESTSLFDALKDNARNNIDLAKINHNLGNSLMKENKIDLAIEAYKNSLRQNPKDEETRYNLAYAQKMKKQDQDKQDQNKQDQNKQDQNKQDQNKQDQNKQDQEEQQEQDKISKEDAEKMLEALQQREKEIQEKLQKKKVKGQKVKILKDW
jgi:tetratricopeptide (TPR) repeat protein